MASHGISRGSGPLVRSEEARQKELQQIDEYKNLADLVNTKIAEKHYTIEVLGLVTKLLNENPEYYTIWNHRRRVLASLVSAETLEQTPDELLQGDLQLTFALLRKFPKCYWIWNHRNWLLREGEALMGAEAAHKLWSGELQLINKMLHADSRNFHAWGYRRFVVSQLERFTPTVAESAAHGTSKGLAESEFEYTTRMIKTNLSNFSAWHNRSQLIPQILRERNADPKERRSFLDSELSLICEAINTDPFDQSIWFYHQYLLSILSASCPTHQLIVQDLTNGERQKYYEHEMEYIREILEDEADCKWIYEALLGLAEASLEVDAGTGSFTTKDMRAWLNELKRLDPLRRGRWDDLERRLSL
ncbi:protein prenylyltransferase [Cucurbitaria berberidis CBS 394.84]|uniref:Geranylgeranyl transferase type-2 subunit alpha n=1 Tax=Cucurbitaria berberidis CBS 394.84 TaxID=1168544 RepID=A0A9P4GSV5_9PLEO|nr:protein prenylyltransferase [Cucurbitaria berberidis CBS 394.84]KAF1851923.1 protein prenylyltransferase [Cucurbitaria berberidis CBS 394.84]